MFYTAAQPTDSVIAAFVQHGIDPSDPNWKQNWFNHIYKFIVKQGRQATDGLQCVYRSPSGMQCAFGCCIPDSLYSKGLEGRGANGVCIEYFPAVFSEEQQKFFFEMQSCHDLALNVNAPILWLKDYKEKMSRYAKKHHLIIPSDDVQ